MIGPVPIGVAAETDATRPRLHFTAAAGWINDPHGIVWADGRYHLFFQYVPDGPVWSPKLLWGHATSADLLSWTEHCPALRPEPPELGCWTGSLVVTDDGPTILYTSSRATAAPNWDIQPVAAIDGSPDLMSWSRERHRILVERPPAEADVVMVRDPFVRRAPDRAGWTMHLGAQIRGDVGAVLQFSSPDLRVWTYDGVTLSAPEQREGLPDLGSMWECPQLLRVEGCWVMVLSIWRGGEPSHVVYALGDYDGARFTPRSWGTFSHGASTYATSVFADVDGRPCAMSWLREDPAVFRAAEAVRAGAHSLPVVLSVERNRLVQRFHPNLQRRRSPVIEPGTTLTLPGTKVELAGEVVSDVEFHIAGGGGDLEVLIGRQVVTVGSRGRRLAAARRSADLSAPITYDLVLDGDVVELLVSGVDGIVAVRSQLPTDEPLELRIRGGSPQVEVHELRP
jgi:beta-fructofuranosidase